MTPHRTGGTSGTYRIDRQFAGIGRIVRASGTTDKRAFAGINGMLDDLYEQGLHSQLMAIRDGALKPMVAYAVYRRGKAEGVPDAPALRALEPAWAGWVEATPNAETRRMRRFAWSKLGPRIWKDAAIADCPAILRQAREDLTATAPTWNRVRACMLAFLKATLGKGHACYREAREVEAATERAARRPAPTPERAVAVRRALGGAAGDLWWQLYLTGMGPKEFDGAWEVEGALIRIHGTKRGARDRIVPRIIEPTQRTLGWKPFRLALATLPRELRVQPYDARRGFAHLLEEARIPRTRRRMYLGHSVKDVTERYETADLASYVLPDAKQISERLAEAEGRSPARAGARRADGD